MAQKKKKNARLAKTQRGTDIKEKDILRKKGFVVGAFNKVSLSESYVSLTVGIIVVIFAAFLTVIFLKQNNTTDQPRQDISAQRVIAELENNNQQGKEQTYIVIPDDDLKAIARRFYGTDIYYSEIVKANNIADENIIEVGQTLKIPYIQTNASLSEKITGNTYTVKENEYLWDIAVKAYGDGFKWIDIAKANNITYPDIIAPGTVLQIPR